MKILMIGLDKTWLDAEYSGDVIDRHKAYAESLDSLDIIIFSKKGFNKKEVENKIKVYPTNSCVKIYYARDAYEIGREICQEKNIDLIVTQDPFLTGLAGWWLKKKFQIPFLVHFHGDFWSNKYWLKEKWYNYFFLLLSKFLVKKADGIRVVSQGIRDKLIKSGVTGDKIKIISTPVNLEKFEKFDKQMAKEIKNKYQNKKIILFVGRLAKVKNLSLLLDALFIVKQKFNDFICLIIGAGPEINNLKSQIANLKLEDSVKLLGATSHNDLANYYGACDFLVLPSLSESFGKVILEAAGAGKPTIATLTTGASELIVDGETGFLVPVNNQEKLAEKIYFLLNNQDLNDNLGRRAKEYIKNKFNQEKSIKKIINFWQEIINPHT